MAETPTDTAAEGPAPLQPAADGRTGPVLVTGATGYVGRRLVPRLLAAGLEVRALARSPESAALPEGVEVVRGDLTDPGSLGPASEGMATVVNLAAVTADRKPPPGGYEAVHADGVAALARAAREAGVARVVHMSGIDTMTGDPGPYLLSRRLGEEAVRESGVPWTMLRPSIMFGGPDAAFVRAMARLVRAPVVPVAGDGRVRLQLVWVEDVARCLVTLVTDDARLGNEYPIGGPDQLTYDEVLDAVGEAMGKDQVRKVHVPMSLVRVQAGLLQVLPSPPVTPAALELFDADNVAAPDAIPSQFGFEPRSFREHLREHGLTG
jgi:NADH dehydrogenase